MSNSSTVQARHLKPFKKGDDPRRNKTGAASVKRAAWTNLFLNALAEQLDPKEAATILATAYRAKRSWAIMETHERLMGRVIQPISGQINGKQTMLIKVVQLKDQNGNGNGNTA